MAKKKKTCWNCKDFDRKSSWPDMDGEANYECKHHRSRVYEWGCYRCFKRREEDVADEV